MEAEGLVFKCQMENKRDIQETMRLEEENMELKKKSLSTATKTEVGCQTMATTKKQDEMIDIRNHKIENFEQLRPLIPKRWNMEGYKITQRFRGDSLKEVGENLILICDKNENRRSKGTRRIINRFPELRECGKNKYEGGEGETLQISSRYKEPGGETKTISRAILIFYIDTTKPEGLMQEDLYKTINYAKESMQDGENPNTTMAIPEDIKGEVLRKMIEVVFMGTEHSIKICYVDQAETKEKRPAKNGNAIIVDANEMTYAETLRTPKTEIKDTAVIKEIKGVRKTGDGKMRIDVSANEGPVMRELERVLKDREVRTIKTNRKTKTVIITDIDSISTEGDVRQAIEGLREEEDNGDKQMDNQLDTVTLRTIRNGNQMAIVRLDEGRSRTLTRIGKIRIGLSMCRIRERVDITKCYKCWGYGHKAFKCENDDRENRCRRCCGENHTKENCPNNPYCPLCKEPGHQAGERICKSFKKALKEISRK